MKIDYHVHTGRTIDAEGSVEDYCRAAIEKGVTEICFTNHQEWASVEDGSYDYALTEEEWKGVILEIEQARKKFPMTIKFGVEVGYYPDRVQELKQFINSYPFDYVLGSVHYVEGEHITGESSSVRPEEEAKAIYQSYFRILKEAIESRLFDCIGHFDLPRKQFSYIDSSYYLGFVSECIGAMVKNRVGFEVNTGGLYRPHKEQYPQKVILARMQEAGVNKVTMGSDCHKPALIAYGFDEVMGLLKEVGFSRICTFRRRAMNHYLI